MTFRFHNKPYKTNAPQFTKNALILATKSVLDGSDLTLTKLDRKLETNTTVKHSIKRVDRLLGIRLPHREKALFINDMYT